MSLRLKELQRIAKRTIRETQQQKNLRDEISKVFGPSVVVSENCEQVAAAANEELDVMESTGRPVPIGSIKASLLLDESVGRSIHIRKLAARLLTERLAAKFLNDPASEVRCAAAKRLPYGLVKESVRSNPGDQLLRDIARAKRLNEVGSALPKEVDAHLDIYGDPLAGALRQKNPLDGMPDSWYERLAHKLCSEYGGNLERQWEEVLATRVASSYYATSGVKLDRDKLLKAILKCLEERDEAVLGEVSLKSIARQLRESALLDEPVISVLEEEADPVSDLIKSNLSTNQYVEAAEKLFSVKKSFVPAGIKKYRLGEGTTKETSVPVKGKLPTPSITPMVETALDRYVESWNKMQASSGEPYRLSWSPHPTSLDAVGFHLELK